MSHWDVVGIGIFSQRPMGFTATHLFERDDQNYPANKLRVQSAGGLSGVSAEKAIKGDVETLIMLKSTDRERMGKTPSRSLP